MSIARASALTGTWVVLLLVTLISFATAEYLGRRDIAIAAIMAIAAIKVGLIMRRFMDISTAPMGIRAYLAGWTIGCAALIAGLWWAAA